MSRWALAGNPRLPPAGRGNLDPAKSYRQPKTITQGVRMPASAAKPRDTVCQGTPHDRGWQDRVIAAVAVVRGHVEWWSAEIPSCSRRRWRCLSGEPARFVGSQIDCQLGDVIAVPGLWMRFWASWKARSSGSTAASVAGQSRPRVDGTLHLTGDRTRPFYAGVL